MIFYRKGAGNSRAQAIFLQPERRNQSRAPCVDCIALLELSFSAKTLAQFVFPFSFLSSWRVFGVDLVFVM